MDAGTGPGAELLSPGEAEWPPELRLPPPPPLPGRGHGPAPAPRNEPSPALHPLQPKKEPFPPRHAEVFDDQHFLGSIMGAATQPQPQQPQPAAAVAPVKRKRGRLPKNRDAAAAAVPAPTKPPVKKKEEEVVCFICFDGGDLVVCDRRGCPKVYHPACIKRDESFFRSRGKWDCGWHICSSCEKAVQYVCYTCTYSLCKRCIGQGNFFGVRGNKGFCDTCYGTILLIESKEEDGAKVRVDFDDKNSWEYLFKLYWLDLKGKHFLTLEELISAKSRWTVPNIAGKREKEESSDESYDANNDQDASFGISSRKRKVNISSGKRGRKLQKDIGVTARKCEISIKSAGSLPNRLQSEGMALQGDKKWASPELLEFVGYMRNGDSSYASRFEIQSLLLEYIEQHNLRDPRRKSQIICDARLSSLFKKPRVGRFEMLKLLEMHFLVKDSLIVNVDSQRTVDPDSAQVDNGGSNEFTAKSGSDKRRKVHKKIERELTLNLEDYAAIDMHNINQIYLRRSLMEDLIDDNAAFSDKIAGAFVRIRICGLGQKQDMYRLVKVLGVHKVAERYSIGKKTADYALEILNLDKKEVITMDTISNQDFTEEECKRLRQSMKFGLVTRLKVGDIYEKAKIFQSLRVTDWSENEKQRLSHLRDRASETGRHRELRQCVEKLKLLNSREERARMVNEVPDVHVDPRMDPSYESAEERDYKKAADWTINRGGSDPLCPGRNGTESNSLENHTQKVLGASGHMSSLPIEDMSNRSGTIINSNNTTAGAAWLSSSGVTSSDTEPEKVWLYKDPHGNVQGPFTLLQLSKWTSYFPRDLRIWLTFESEKRSLLLTEVLLKQQKDFVQPTAVTGDTTIWAGTGQDRINSSLVANNLSCIIGYNGVYSSTLSSLSAEFSDPSKESSKVPFGTLPLKSVKDAYALHGQVQHQVNYSHTIPSSTVSHGPPGSHDNRQNSGGMCSPTVSPMNNMWKSNAEPHPDMCAMKDQLKNDSKSNSLTGSVEEMNSHLDSGSQKVSVLTPQQAERDPANSLGTISPLEFKIVCKQEGSCRSSATNASTHDNLQLSIALEKPGSCSPTNPVEDRVSSPVLGLPSQSGAPTCLPQPVPSMSTNNSSKTEATMNRHDTCLPDASSKPFEQHSGPNNDPVFSSNTHDLEYKYPSPTPKLARKETFMNQSRSTSVIPKDSDTKTRVHSTTSFVSETYGTPASEIGSLQSPKQTSCLEERHLRGTTAQKVQVNEEDTAVKRKNIIVNPISDAVGITVSDVLESLTEQNYQKNSLHGAEHLENSVPASTEEEQPQCSSPIALSPWGEPSYYQGEAVDSALWGVKDDPTNDMWSMPSPTPALQASSDLGTDGKDTSRIIEEVMTARGNSAFVETLPKQGEKKMEQGNSSVSTASGALEPAKPKPGAALGPSPDGKTKASVHQLPGSSLEGSAKALGCKPPGLSLEGIEASRLQTSGSSLEGGAEGWQPSDSSQQGGTKVSGCQPSDIPLEGGEKASGWKSSSFSTEGGTKASGRQRSSSSPDGSRKGSCWQPSPSASSGSAKASGWQRSSTSPEGSRKASGWQQPGSSTQGNTRASGWEPSGSSAEGNAKVDGWQRTSSSPEGSRKTSGWHSSVRESSRVNSTSGANDNRKSSSHQATTPTAKNPWEAQKRQGNNDKNTAGWGEALGNNRSWYPSSGNASRGSQGGHHHDRHSHGSDSRWGSSNHSRRSDHLQDRDHRQDHDRGRSSRSLSRGPPQRGVCKYYESGNCWKGKNCQYLHR